MGWEEASSRHAFVSSFFKLVNAINLQVRLINIKINKRIIIKYFFHYYYAYEFLYSLTILKLFLLGLSKKWSLPPSLSL